MRFATDDRVTVTDPKHWHYGEQGIVEDYDYDAVGGARRYLVSFDGREPFPFSVEQPDQLTGNGETFASVIASLTAKRDELRAAIKELSA